MTVFIYHCFEHLKEKVLEQANIKTLTTGDCHLLSAAILTKTKKSISETTLKRVYGFANTRFKPSSFTLNTLAEFCDAKNWESYCSTVKNTPSNTIDENNIFSKAEIISRNTLQALKNRSSVPYQYTIDRRVFHHHLTVFEDEKYNATIIVGPAGSGKTIGLCHWLNERMALNSIKNSDDIYLFFSSQLLNSALLHEDSLEQWLLNLLGVEPTKDISQLFKDTDRKFYLIIDGFDEHLFKSYQFENILNQVVDVVSCYKDADWFKVILTMTSVTWLSYKSVISQFHIIRDKWYLGLMHEDNSRISNITPFSYEELLLLSEKISPDAILPDKISDNAYRFLSHPEYFTYFYHAYSKDFSLKHAHSAAIYQLISSFILDKIYTGRNSSEKVTLIDFVVKNINWRKNDVYAKKTDLQIPLKTHNTSYRDLLNFAVLAESNKSDPLTHLETIAFVDNNMARYFLAKNSIDENKGIISQELVQKAQFITVGNDDYLGALKWVVLHAIRHKQFKVFEYISSLKLHPEEKLSIFIFVCESFGHFYDELNEDDTFNLFLRRDFIFFNTFCKISFADPAYTVALDTLLKFNLPEEKIVLVRCLLSMSHLLSADIEKTRVNIEELAKIPQDVLVDLPYNPINGIKALYAYFLRGRVEKTSFKEITQLLFNPDELLKSKNVYEMYMMIAVYVTMIYSNYKKTSRFIDLVRLALPRINGSISTEVKLWLSIVECRSAIYTGNISHAHDLYSYITNRYEHHQNNFTSSMKLSYLLVKSQAILFLQVDGDILLIDKKIASLAQATRFLFFELAHKAFLVNTKNFNKLSVSEIQIITLNLVKQIKAKGMLVESFIISFPNKAYEEKIKSSA